MPHTTTPVVAPARYGRIVLTRTAQGWMADYTRTDKAEGFIALFGTAALPLPFTAAAEADDVLAHMHRIEPFVDIRS